MFDATSLAYEQWVKPANPLLGELVVGRQRVGVAVTTGIAVAADTSVRPLVDELVVGKVGGPLGVVEGKIIGGTAHTAGGPLAADIVLGMLPIAGPFVRQIENIVKRLGTFIGMGTCGIIPPIVVQIFRREAVGFVIAAASSRDLLDQNLFPLNSHGLSCRF
jgi:hypothetical protein